MFANSRSRLFKLVLPGFSSAVYALNHQPASVRMQAPRELPQQRKLPARDLHHAERKVFGPESRL